MSRHTTAILSNATTDDYCPLTLCLKKLFTRSAKSKTTFGFTISRNIGDVKKELEQLNKENIPELSYAYLAAMERSMPGDGFRYAVIYKQNVPVLFGYFQLFTLTSKNFSLEKNRAFVKGMLRFFLDLKKIKVLISGNALRTETACYCVSDNVLGKVEAAEVITAVAEKIAGEEKTTAIILKDIPLTAQSRKWLKGMGYQQPWDDKVMVMEVDSKWHTLSDYISLLTRKYKTRANKILASGNALIVKELVENEIAHYERELHDLFGQVVANQSFVLIQPLPGNFAQMKKVYRNDFEVFGFLSNLLFEVLDFEAIFPAGN
jgi:hypothetical protein